MKSFNTFLAHPTITTRGRTAFPSPASDRSEESRFATRSCAVFLGLLLPAVTLAHPGHEGIPVHSMSALILTAAGYYAVKYTVSSIATLLRRHRVAV